MSTTQVLNLPDFSKVFVMEFDASGTGIGVVLTHEGHPNTFYSKKLIARLMIASAYVRELYAVTKTVKKWRHYLLGRRFIIKTDNRSLKKLMHQVIQTHEQQFYLTKLMGFQYDIQYRTGSSNKLAHAQSRVEELNTLTLPVEIVYNLTSVQHETHLALVKAN